VGNTRKEMLKEIFLKLMNKYTDQNDYILECWNEIENEYTLETRYYHNLVHIENMLAELKGIESDVKDKDALLFSIYYHDIIYNTTKSDNEFKSAMLFQKRIERTSFKQIEKCVKQIELTKEHKLSIDSDANILLDLDLSILGKSKKEYLEYSESIRGEYKMYSDYEYRNGRKKVLIKLLNIPTIYKTDYFKKKYEVIARNNLNLELKSLN
jgi:predicted metal-dependent HD superfamily phosphohydrolase